MKSKPTQTANDVADTSGEMIAWLLAEVGDSLVEDANARTPLETGGILMGYWGAPDGTPVILHATGPGRRSGHSTHFYRPDHKHDKKEIARLYEKSGRRLSYLGDWHTHPAAIPYLSARDKSTLRRIARCRPARVKCPIMLILSKDKTWTPAVWQGSLLPSWLYSKRLALVEREVRLFQR